MRTIKFRAWDKKRNNMILHIREIDFALGKIKSEYDLDIVDGQNSGNHYRGFEHIELMQFTGLHDKNGVEIYEGDWCRAEFRGKDEITVIQGQIIIDEFMWCIDCTGCVGDNIFSINRPHNFEVIGNIYQNPNLIK